MNSSMHAACRDADWNKNKREKWEHARVRETKESYYFGERGMQIMYSTAKIRLIQHDARPTLDYYQRLSSHQVKSELLVL